MGVPVTSGGEHACVFLYFYCIIGVFGLIFLWLVVSALCPRWLLQLDYHGWPGD